MPYKYNRLVKMSYCFLRIRSGEVTCGRDRGIGTCCTPSLARADTTNNI